MSGMVPIGEVRALLVAVVDALERWVPEPCRDAELANLIAVGQQIAGGALAASGGSGVRRRDPLPRAACSRLRHPDEVLSAGSRYRRDWGRPRTRAADHVAGDPPSRGRRRWARRERRDRSSAGSGQFAGSGRLSRGVDWVAPKVPAALALRAVRHLAAAALAFLGDLRCGVRAPPVLTLPAARLAHGHTRRDGCRGLHQGVYLK
jgi:hypothetical protein